MSTTDKTAVEKAAYTAVGAPIAAVKAVNARLHDLREAIRSSRSDMSEDLAKEFEVWVAEGERVVNRALERLRDSETIERARTTSQKVRERVTASVEEMRREIDDVLDIVEPEETLETIKGIGPGYAERLHRAGVAGITSLLEHTSTDEGVERLAAETGLSTDLISQWRERADLSRVTGVGDNYRRLLHRAGVWTVPQLAAADVSELASLMAQIEAPGMPEQIPAEDRLSAWVTEAKTLDSPS